jgi:hypothetical protein
MCLPLLTVCCEGQCHCLLRAAEFACRLLLCWYGTCCAVSRLGLNAACQDSSQLMPIMQHMPLLCTSFSIMPVCVWVLLGLLGKALPWVPASGGVATA